MCFSFFVFFCVFIDFKTAIIQIIVNDHLRHRMKFVKYNELHMLHDFSLNNKNWRMINVKFTEIICFLIVVFNINFSLKHYDS